MTTEALHAAGDAAGTTQANVFGDALAAFDQGARMLEEAYRRCGAAITDDSLLSWVRTWYLWRLGDRMFRHEALEWVAQWATAKGRTLRIYGNGWEDHPTLAEFAAGGAENGRELNCIYRASRINLQLMPAGFIHQRALDGLAAGGFFLTRLVPHDHCGRSLRRLIQRMGELGIDTNEAFAACADTTVSALLGEFYGAHTEHMRSHYPNLFDILNVSAESLFADEVFDDFERIVFDSAESFAQRAELYLSDEQTRIASAGAMREKVLQHFSYQAAMRRFLGAMTTYLQDAAAQ